MRTNHVGLNTPGEKTAGLSCAVKDVAIAIRWVYIPVLKKTRKIQTDTHLPEQLHKTAFVAAQIIHKIVAAQIIHKICEILQEQRGGIQKGILY